ncbi:MAG TPA: Crp/Fnr family transcriptional regulator [Terriglobales bacterium]|nr:Crp/Fnr family transcriptional regulator [Terriglobales bacterium]
MAESTGVRRAPALRLPTFLTTAGPGRKFLSFNRGEFIFRQGESSEKLFFVREGRVRASVTTPTGKEATVGIFGAGDLFGLSCLVLGKNRTVSACALTHTDVTALTRRQFLEYLHTDSNFADLALDRIVKRLAQYEEELTHHIVNNSERRLARSLLHLSGHDGNGSKVIEGVTQEMLAAMVGTTRPRINGFMNKFRRLGYVEYHGDRIRVSGTLMKVLL